MYLSRQEKLISPATTIRKNNFNIASELIGSIGSELEVS